MTTQAQPRLRHPPARLRHCAAAVGLLACSAAALAQDPFSLDEPAAPPPDPEAVAELTEIQNWIEFGLGWVSDDAFRFGRYSGLQREGGYGVLSLDYLRRGPYDGERADYVRVTATDLGLATREASVEYGRQGDFRLRLEHDQIPAFRSDSARTIFRDAGSARLTLPGDWVAAQNTAGMTALLPSLGEVAIEQRRRRTGVGLDKHAFGRWVFSTGYSVEDRDGTRTLGGVFGNSGGNPRAVLLPEPVDYQTRTFDAAARYADPGKQLQFAYHLSLFDNDNAALAWQNPYAAITGWEPSAGHPTGFGQLALPPDNRFHQLSAAGGWNLGQHTRLSADLALGRMTQDEAFLPYTVDPVLAASITQPLPRQSLDGRIDTTVANLRLTSRAGERLQWGASLRYDDRDNRTPRDEYVYIGGDSQRQDTGPTSSRRRFNEPYSYEELRLRLDAAWRMDAGRLTGAAERREIDRTYTEREQAEEDILTIGATRDFSDWLGGSLRLRHAERSGSTYHGEEPFLSGYAAGYTDTVAGGWENPPNLRKFHLADRDRDQLALLLTLTPSERWSFGLEVDRAEDDYTRSVLGLTRSAIDGYSVEATWTPATSWSAHAFWTWEDLQFDQNGHSISGGPGRVDNAADPARAWRARHDDRVDTIGAGLEWREVADRLDLGLDLLHAESRSDVEVTAGAALSAAPLPTLRTRLQSAGLRARYRLGPGLALGLRYWFERYRSSDWALDGVAANQLANVILLGETSPDYRVHVVVVSLTYRF